MYVAMLLLFKKKIYIETEVDLTLVQHGSAWDNAKPISVLYIKHLTIIKKC